MTENSNDLFFVGKEFEVIENNDLGVLEVDNKEFQNSVSQKIFLFSSLLSPDPFPEIIIKAIPVFLPKYAPFNTDL